MQLMDSRQSNLTLAQELSELKRHLARVSQEKELFEKRCKDFQDHEAQLGHANRILEKDVKALSHQVVTLLSRLEIRQGYRKSRDVLEGLNQLPPDSSELLHTKLTSFKDIEDLQQQNLKLTRALRELTARVDGDEAKHSHRIEYLETALKKEAQPLIEDLQSALKSNSKTVVTLQAENETLRKLAEVDPGSKLPQLQEILEARLSGKDFHSPMFVRKTEERLAEERNKIKALQDEVDFLREATHSEKSNYEIRISELKITIKTLQDNSEQKAKEVFQLKSDLNLSLQKQNILKSERAATKDKHDKLQVSNQHLETELEQLSQSHKVTCEILQTSQAENARLVEQGVQLNAQIAGLQKEHDLISIKLAKDKATQAKLEESLLANMEQALEERRTYYTQVKELQDCLISQRARHDQVQLEYLDRLKASVQELESCQKALEASQASLKETNTAKAKLGKDLQRSDDVLLSSAGSSQQLVKELNLRLKRAQDEIEELKANELQYQSIAQAAESLLQSSLQESKDSETQLKGKVTQLEDQLEQMQAQQSHEQANAESKITQLKGVTVILQDDKESLESQLMISQDHLNKDRATLQGIQAHNAALEAQLQEITMAYSTLEATIAEAQKNFEDKTNETKTQSERLEKSYLEQWAIERNALTKEIECLNQNNLDLKVIIESLSLKTPDPQGLITFLRQEKDRADGRLQSSLINNKRLQAEIDVANSALKNTRKLVGGFNDPNDELRSTLRELEAQVAQLNETKERLESENSRLAAKVQSLSNINGEENLGETIQNLKLEVELKTKEITLLYEANQRSDQQIQTLLAKQANPTQDQQSSTQPKESKLSYEQLHGIALNHKRRALVQKGTIEALQQENQNVKGSLAKLSQALNIEDASEDSLLSAIQTLKEAASKGPVATTPGADSFRARGLIKDRLGVYNDSPSQMSFVRRPIVHECDDDSVAAAKRTRPNPGIFPRSPIDNQDDEN